MTTTLQARMPPDPHVEPLPSHHERNAQVCSWPLEDDLDEDVPPDAWGLLAALRRSTPRSGGYGMEQLQWEARP